MMRTVEPGRALLAAITLFIVAVALVLVAVPRAEAHHVNDGGVDAAWDNAMNQESFWESYFANAGRTVDCTQFHDHDGFIPATFDAAVVKDGNFVRIYDKPGPYTALGPVNPATGDHFPPPHSWVMKCKFTLITTTTSSTTTTSTTQPTTTSSSTTTSSTTSTSTTTTTQPTTTSSSTTTTSTTTTQPTTTTSSTTTTSTTTTQPTTPTTQETTTTTSTTVPTVTDEPPTEVSDTKVSAEQEPEVEGTEVLPFTGAETDVLLGLAVVIFGLGVLVLVAEHGREES